MDFISLFFRSDIRAWNEMRKTSIHKGVIDSPWINERSSGCSNSHRQICGDVVQGSTMGERFHPVGEGIEETGNHQIESGHH